MGGHIWPASAWHRDQAMRVCGSGDVRRRRLPYRSGNAYIGEPRFHLATRPLLPQHDGAPRIVAHDVEGVLADIDADHDDRSIGYLRHGVLLVFGAPCQLRLLAGQEHDRTIPLTDIRSAYDQVRGHSSVRSAIAFTANVEAPSHP